MNVRADIAQAYVEAIPVDTPDGPIPLIRETPAGAAYPVPALGPLDPAARAIHDITQAPVAIAAQSVLGVAALAVQGHANVETLSGAAPISLYLLTVAKSGERKSSCDKLAMRPVWDFEDELRAERNAALDAHLNEQEVWQERRKAILKRVKGDPEGVRADLHLIGPAPRPPLYPTICAAEPTIEGIGKHLDQLRASLGLFSDEGGAFIGGYGMTAENRLKTLAGLSRLWDGSALDRWRAGEGVASFPGRRLSLHLMMQPVVAVDVLSDKLASGQGFLARCLVTYPSSAIGSRLRIGHSPQSDVALIEFSRSVTRLLRREMPLREKCRNELDPPVLALSKKALSVLREYYLAVEAAQADGGPLAEVQPAASKAAENAARIAAVLTLFENPAAVEVDADTMANAVALAVYYVDEAARLSDTAAISKATADAEQMRRWLLEKWTEAHICVTDAVQRGPFKETQRAEQALTVLQQHRWIAPIDGGAEILGRKRRKVWRIVRETVE